MIQAKMADMYVRLNTSRSYLYNVARALDNGHFASKVGKLFDITYSGIFFMSWRLMSHL